MSASTAAASAAVIAAGSQSFAAAAKLLPARQRDDARRLYAWCRWCDDVMDGQTMGHDAVSLTADDRRARLAELERATRSALAGEPQTELPFQALQQVADRIGLEPRWPLGHLAGFAADVEPAPFADLDALLGYCWGVAGVVGVMMARVMGVAANDLDTLRRAQDLGLAFQLTNIARDVGEDARNGRVYLPGDLLGAVAPTPEALLDPANAAAVSQAVQALVEAAEPYYASAMAGLPKLRLSAAWGIAAARAVYREIGKQAVRGGEGAYARRVVVGPGRKRVLALAALAPALASRRAPRKARPDLWTAI